MAEPAWRDQLQPASFRGVAFSVAAADGELGRRNVVHEYPLRDLPYAEDLGRKARVFSIEALVIGADYMSARDKLAEAIEKPGSGELVHPYRGRVQVVVTSARLSESTDQGGLARFSLTFTESGEPVNPSPQADIANAVNAAADAAEAEAESSFADLFTVDGFQDFVSTEALAMLNGGLDSIRLAANSLLGAALMPEFTRQLFGIADSLTSLILSPVNLATGLFGQVTALSSIANNPLAALSSLRSLFGFGGNAKPVPNSIPGGTTFTLSRQQQAANQAATISLIRHAAVIQVARVSATITSASFSEAIALRDEIAGQLEELADSADDTLYMALTDLRIAVIKDINARAADLARTVQYTPPATLPALVVAYNLYGAIANTEDIIARNAIRHPGFVPGGRALEMLTP